MSYYAVTTKNAEQHLKLTTADDWDNLCITEDGEIFSLHASGSLTPEQLQEVVDFAKSLREATK